jgi:hypothetical protein
MSPVRLPDGAPKVPRRSRGSLPACSPGRRPALHYGFSDRQRTLYPFSDQFPLLRHRRLDPQHQLIGSRHVGRTDRGAVLQQLR